MTLLERAAFTAHNDQLSADAFNMIEAHLAASRVKPDTKRGRLAHIDGLRGLTALFVVVHHMFMTAFVGRSTPAALGFLAYGHFAVVVFFVLSGYSLALSSNKNGHRLKHGSLDFFKQRVRRIAPPYLAALVISLLMALTVVSHKTGTTWDTVLPIDWKSIPTYALLTQDFLDGSQNNTPNYVFWSIAVEFHAYFLFPLFLWLRRRTGGPFLLLGFGALCTLIASWLFFNHPRVLLYDFALIPVFLFGMLASSKAHFLSPSRVPWFAVSTALWAAAIAYVGMHNRTFIERDFWIIDPLIGAAAATLLVALERSNRAQFLRNCLSTKQLVTVGVFSYSLYLIHAPVLQLLYQINVKRIGLTGISAFVMLVVTALPCILVAAWLFFQAFEKPYLSRRAKNNAETATPASVTTTPALVEA